MDSSFSSPSANITFSILVSLRTIITSHSLISWTLYTSRTHFLYALHKPYRDSFRPARLWTLHFKHIYSYTYFCDMDTWTILNIGRILIYCILFIRVYTTYSAATSTSNTSCRMQSPIDIPLPRQTSSPHSLDSSGIVSPPSPLSDSTSPLSSSQNTFRSRRLATPHHALPSGSQPNRRPSEYTRQWSLFGQLMEIEGQLPSSIGSTHSHPNESDGDISVHEHAANSPLRTRLNSSFHTQYSAEPISYDAPFPYSITNNYEPDSSSSSAASLDVPSRAIPPFRLPTFTNTHRNVLKCAIAYFIASLFTFSPHLSRFISDLSSYGPNDPTTPSPSGHMVATMYGE